MKRNVWIGSIVLIVLILAVAYFGLYYHPSRPKIRKETLSNITELYSLFAPYMKSYVTSHLQGIECQPNEYYYNDSCVCFLCKKFDVCFSYTWVNLTGGEKMNPREAPYLTNYETFDSKVADFYKDRLATNLNCKPRNKSALSCDMSVSFILLEKDVKMFLLDQTNFESVSEFICNNFNKVSLECEENVLGIHPELKYSCRCENIVIWLKENGEIDYAFIPA